MPTIREIVFENNSPKVCYSGQLLKGKVKVFFPTNNHVEAMYITFSGYGFCQWSNDGEQITGSKKYLNIHLDLLGNSSTDDVVVPAGNNQYAFEIQLPPTLPTSYEGTYGFIRYSTSLHIDRSAKKIDPLHETFTIINPLNLNTSPSYRMPMEVSKFSKFTHCGYLSCWKADLNIFARLPVRAYCPGQTMNLKLDVVNHSYVDIVYFLVHFIQEVTYIADGGQTKVDNIILTERQCPGSRADRNGIEIKINILVPSLPPTNFSADICGSSYKFGVTVKRASCRSNPYFEIPVIIGTYPITNELYALSNCQTSDVNQSTHFEATAPLFEDLDLPPYPDTDPPSYEEAIHNVAALNSNDSTFIPKYPIYRRQTTYSSELPPTP